MADVTIIVEGKADKKFLQDYTNSDSLLALKGFLDHYFVDEA